MDQSFGKTYKLCSQKLMESLFQEGNSVKAFPLKLIFLEAEHPGMAPFQVLLSVPKKKFKHAHDRNYLKRCMREALRKNKSEIEQYLTSSNKKLIFALVYLSDERLPYLAIEQRVIKAITQLKTELGA
ncbi:MAG: hypothetical protein RLZZ301_53 [Bacteroidota bacterium]|jgi:ribonuclease P protein component